MKRTRSLLILMLLLCGLVSMIGKAAGQAPVANPSEPALTSYQQATLRVEWIKTIGTMGAILVPLLIGVLTLRSQAKTAFQLKAAELVVQAPTPWVAQQRAVVIEKMFAKRLKGFTSSFNFSDFPGIRLHDMKIELVRLLAAHPAERDFILKEWQRQFPNDMQKFGY